MAIVRNAILFCLLASPAFAGKMLMNPYRFTYPTPTPEPAATPVFVQQKSGTTASGTLIITLDAPATTGNVLIVTISYSSTDTINEVTTFPGAVASIDSQVSSMGSGIATDIWSGFATEDFDGPVTAIRIIAAFGLTRISASITEWSGLNAGAATATNSATGNGTTVTTGSVTPVAGNLIIGVGGWVLNDYSSGPTNSFTRLTQTGGGTIWLESGYILQPTATAKSTGWTLTAGIQWAAAIAAFH